ncbi:hypothetical protein CR513_49759, partial [Mucuna pruriens]
MAFGKGPSSWLKLTSNTVRFFKSPISEGKHDRNALFIKMISFKLDMFPRLAGMQPWNLLLASTMTETGEFPKLSGRSKTKRLSLMKMASRSLSNNSLGTVPSNSLNLRSKNLSDGRRRTTSGNFPANLVQDLPAGQALPINAGHGADLGVIRRGSTVNSGVAAHVGSNPIGCLVARIRQNGLLPSLQGYISISETVIFESKRRVYAHIFSSVAELVSVVEKLALPNVHGFGVGEVPIA